MVLTGSAKVDEIREENNKKRPGIDHSPFRPFMFVIRMLECLVVGHFYLVMCLSSFIQHALWC